MFLASRVPSGHEFPASTHKTPQPDGMRLAKELARNNFPISSRSFNRKPKASAAG